METWYTAGVVISRAEDLVSTFRSWCLIVDALGLGVVSLRVTQEQYARVSDGAEVGVQYTERFGGTFYDLQVLFELPEELMRSTNHA